MNNYNKTIQTTIEWETEIMKVVKITGMSELDLDTLLDWTPMDQTDFKDSCTVEYIEV